MELIKAENTGSRITEPALSISSKGVFSFNKAATEKFKLIDKHIDLLYDKKEPSNWYMKISDKGELKMRDHNDNNAKCNSSSIASQIKDSTKNDINKTLKAKFGKPTTIDEEKYYPLLIKEGNVRNF